MAYNILSRIRSQNTLGLKIWKRWSSDATESGKKWAALWGNGDFGRLGLSSPMSKWEPTICKSLQHHQPRSIACGGAHTLILTEQGRVFATGLNDFGQLGVPFETKYTQEPIEVVGLPEGISQIFAGYYHSSAISGEGVVYVWGSNSTGQLGLGKKAPRKVPVANKVEALSGIRIKMIALGSEHSIALSEDGEVLSWGTGKNGQLGHGNQSSMFKFRRDSSEYTPKLIKSLEGVEICRISAGLLHSACIDGNGSVYTFGQGRMYQLGLGHMQDSSSPSIVKDLPFVQQVACGGYHTCAITRNGDLYTWGSSEYGCLGLGSKSLAPLPERVEGNLLHLHVSEVSCGWKHTAAISDGDVFTWGWGGSQGTFSEDGFSSGGQLGLGSDFDYLKPAKISFDQNVKALQISCGFNHTAAILEEA
eukprot:Gb_33143 [translate_table: standard]